MGKKCYVIGVYPPPYGGATVKCELFCDTLKSNQIEVEKIDIYEAGKSVGKALKVLKDCVMAYRSSNDIVYCLDSKRLIVMVMLQGFFRKSYERTTTLIIGGVFHKIVDKHYLLRRKLKRMKGIWVETEGMKTNLRKRGIDNIKVFPNPKTEKDCCKPKKTDESQPLQILYFSQISKEKGVEDIISLTEMMDKDNYISYHLDFYGHVVPEFEEKFNKFVYKFKNVSYCGVFDSTKSSVYKKLNEYDLLLFPTHWDTEGVPGILVEAKMAGIAVIASDKSYNSEIIQVDKAEGFLLHQFYAEEMYDIIKKLNFNRDCLQMIKEGSSKSRKRYALEEYYNMIKKSIGGDQI